jgi:hypothetical protein
MITKTPIFHAYLLRCWREEEAAPEGAPRWRFSMEEVLHERRRWGFTDLESVLAFLQAELAEGSGEPIAESRDNAEISV